MSDAAPAVCLAVFGAAWVALAIAPRYRMDWLLENLMTLAIVPSLVLTYRRFRFSDRAYVQGTIMLLLHTLGSHYTYSEVPVGEWLRELFGWSRNHYDRIVHFSFGLLIFRPVLEITFHHGAVRMRRAEKLWLVAAQVGFWSLLYEIIEWLTAVIVDPAAGTAFLGTQGDPWDAQKDMALACVGAAIAGLYERRALARDEAALRRLCPQSASSESLRNEPGRELSGAVEAERHPRGERGRPL